MASWCFILVFPLSLKTGCSICLLLVLFKLFLSRFVLSCLDIFCLEISILQSGYSFVHFVSHVLFPCIVHNAPLPFVPIRLYGFLNIVVYIQSIFDIVPFPHQSCLEVVFYYILNMSYKYLHSLGRTICLNRFLGLKDYFIVYFLKILWINHLCFPVSYSIPPVFNYTYLC